MDREKTPRGRIKGVEIQPEIISAVWSQLTPQPFPKSVIRACFMKEHDAEKLWKDFKIIHSTPNQKEYDGNVETEREYAAMLLSMREMNGWLITIKDIKQNHIYFDSVVKHELRHIIDDGVPCYINGNAVQWRTYAYEDLRKSKKYN